MKYISKLSVVASILMLCLSTSVGAKDKEKGVQLSCAGTSCIQIGVRRGGWTLYFYTNSPNSITVERAMQQALTPIGTALSYTATYFHNPAGYAAMIIDGTPKSTNGSFGEKYWALCINGSLADKGMSAQRVTNGTKVLWVYGKYPANCSM